MEAGGSSTQSIPHVGSLQIDEDHHWELVTFIVENHVFRLPVHRFIEESETFTKLYGLDELLALPVHGQSHPLFNAIELKVDIRDFRAFLKVLYPRRRTESVSPTTYDEWVSVLKLSTQWHFNKLRKEVIATLDEHKKLSTIERIKLAEEHHISSWLIQGYHTLVERTSEITEAEGEQIGWRAAIKLCGMRERRIQQGYLLGSIERSLRTTFASDLVKIQESEAKYDTETKSHSENSPTSPATPRGESAAPIGSASRASDSGSGTFTFEMTSTETNSPNLEVAESAQERPSKEEESAGPVLFNGWGGWTAAAEDSGPHDHGVRVKKKRGARRT